MANTFQQQAQRRKLIYIATILVLFTASWVFRRNSIDKQADALAIREQSRGEVELTGSIVRLGLTGSRGLATCFLWSSAIDKQKKNQWNQLEVLVRALTKLQPHFITPWLFQSWNLAYNVSVEADRPRDKYFYVSRGIELLAEGERQNKFNPDLRWNIGFYTEHKIGKSDETNILRSLFQLSLIPPNERDPARFYTQTAAGPQFNLTEFARFCFDHPQLIRRLREGIHRDTAREKSRLFRCETPQDVVQFLQDNYHVPSLYEVPPLAGINRTWDSGVADVKLAPEAQFPVLPPPHKPAFDEKALTSAMQLGDGTDPFLVANAWYSYAQEPLPEPDRLPGSSKPVTDRATQRRPRNMTTLIFRNYPAQGLRFSAERLQAEGWYDSEKYDISDWFENADGEVLKQFDPQKKQPAEAKIGGGSNLSELAWGEARNAWTKHGRENHILLPPAEEANLDQRAKEFARGHTDASGAPLPLNEERLRDPVVRAQFEAAQFLFEYNFYRDVSNFKHHYTRAVAESKPAVILCRKYFFKAEQAYMRGEPGEAVELYDNEIDYPDGQKLSPLTAWRDLLLKDENKDYRRDNHIQETTAEFQIRYLRAQNAWKGNRLRKDIGRVAVVLPLVPRFGSDSPRPPIIQGPFEVRDKDNFPLVPEPVMEQMLERMQLPRRRPPVSSGPAPGPPPGMGRPGMGATVVPPPLPPGGR